MTGDAFISHPFRVGFLVRAVQDPLGFPHAVIIAKIIICRLVPDLLLVCPAARSDRGELLLAYRADVICPAVVILLSVRCLQPFLYFVFFRAWLPPSGTVQIACIAWQSICCRSARKPCRFARWCVLLRCIPAKAHP